MRSACGALGSKRRPADQPSFLRVAQRLDHRQHLFVGDEAPAVTQLVAVDGLGQLAGRRRQLVVAVGELPALAGRDVDDRFGLRRSRNVGSGESNSCDMFHLLAVRPGRIERGPARRSRPSARIGWPRKSRPRLPPVKPPRAFVLSANRPMARQKVGLGPTISASPGQGGRPIVPIVPAVPDVRAGGRPSGCTAVGLAR